MHISEEQELDCGVLPVGRQPEVGDLSQIIHAVQHWEDLLGMPHEVWINVIYVTCNQYGKNEAVITQCYLMFTSLGVIKI